MRRLRLSTFLVAVNVGLLLFAVVGVATVAVRLLQQLADEQALARVEQAGISARQQINNAASAAATSAQLLSERPTLRRLLQENDRAAIDTFLIQFQRTSQLDGVAVLDGETVVGQSGSALPWPEIVTAPGTNERGFLLQSKGGNALLIGARAPIPTSDRRVAVAIELDDEFASRLAKDTGLHVSVLPRQVATAGVTAPLNAVRARALESDRVAASRLDDGGIYVAAAPLQAPSGSVIGIVETTLPTASVGRSLQQLLRTLLLLSLGVLGVAAVLSLLVGRRVARPLGDLSDAASRIGSGDLLTPIPAAPGAEVGTLASTLEDMRWRLLRLTDDLRRQQAEAQTILTGIVEGVFSVDRERRIRFLNPQAAAMLGTTPEAAIGQFCGDVLHPQGPDGTRPCAEHCPIVHARFRGSARATEHLLLSNGERRSVAITSASTADELQVQVMRDETEIEMSRRARDAILANISHEFRTPLSAQLASIELLLDQLPSLSLDQIAQLVRAQQRGTLRLTQLIDNLLESARIEAGQNAIRRQPVALDEVIEEALELTRPLLDQRKQTANVQLPYPLPFVQGDGPRLVQVFVNLLGNAQKFAPAGSTIEIGGTVDQETISVWVADQGPGLPTAAGQKLFHRFVRSTKEEPEQAGAGLGLALVKSIVERHGGQIDARSTEYGTRMSIILPIKQAQ